MYQVDSFQSHIQKIMQEKERRNNIKLRKKDFLEKEDFEIHEMRNKVLIDRYIEFFLCFLPL